MNLEDVSLTFVTRLVWFCYKFEKIMLMSIENYNNVSIVDKLCYLFEFVTTMKNYRFVLRVWQNWN